MKHLLSLFFLSCAFIPTLQAQEKRDTIRAKNSIEAKQKIADELGLDKKKAKELKEVNKEFAGKLKELRTDSSLTKMQKRTQMRSLMEQREAKLKTILTAEQLAKYKELQKEQIKNRRNNQGKKEEMDDMMMDEN
ncbi:MAG: hypothetical protein EAZ16_06930 [Sphingobacteriales bacterium]|jgi:hypothetical protein|nr:MAG: hypothetical protein EAZ16_06930 [Sphingobacteriales bacterium]